MIILPETQQPFANFVLRGESQKRILPFVKANGLTAEQRLNVYRNNTQLGLTEALRDGYPVVNKLVGTKFFNQLAGNFLKRHPPTNGCLLFFGSQFSDFIDHYEPTSTLPYLPDVARLEWLWHEAFHEANGAALDITVLTKVDTNTYGNLGLILQPSARFLVSEFPILEIWQSNQESYEGDGFVDLAKRGCRLLIYRPALEIVIIPLSEADYLFLNLLDEGLTLTQVVKQVIAKDSTFDVLTTLQLWFAYGLFSDFFIKV